MTPPSLHIGKYVDNKPAYPHEKSGFQQIFQLFQFMFLFPVKESTHPLFITRTDHKDQRVR